MKENTIYALVLVALVVLAILGILLLKPTEVEARTNDPSVSEQFFSCEEYFMPYVMMGHADPLTKNNIDEKPKYDQYHIVIPLPENVDLIIECPKDRIINHPDQTIVYKAIEADSKERLYTDIFHMDRKFLSDNAGKSLEATIVGGLCLLGSNTNCKRLTDEEIQNCKSVYSVMPPCIRENIKIIDDPCDVPIPPPGDDS